MDPVEEPRRLPRLVGLEMADEVPAQALGGEVGERGRLALGFLDAVLADVAHAGGERLAHGFGRMGLAHGHEGDLARRTAGPRRRPGDALPDGGHAVGDHFLGLSACSRPWAVATFCALEGFMERYLSRLVTASGTLFWPTRIVPM